MSKFCIDLENMTLPDAIAALCEAWYDAQGADTTKEEDEVSSLVRFSEWVETSGISRSTAYELLKLLQIEPEARRVPSSRKPVSHLTTEQIRQLQPWAQKIANGLTVAKVKQMLAWLA